MEIPTSLVLPERKQKQMLNLDNTKREQFVTCDRNYYWPFKRGLKPNQGSTALRYGTVWHSTMEGLYSHIMKHGWTRDGKAIEQAVDSAKKSWEEETAKQHFVDDYRTRENCLRSLVAYLSHFNYDEGILKITSVEQVFKILMPVDNLLHFPYATRAGSFYFTGKLDLGVELNMRPWHMDHKSTGQAIALQESRLNRSAQQMGYTYAGQRISGESPEGSFVVIHHLSAYKSKKTNLYGEPKIDFKRVPQIYTDEDIESWKISLIDTAESILKNEDRGLWPMEHDNCYRYGRCVYAPLCDQNAKLGEEVLEGFFESEPWDVTKTVPEKELIIVE